MRSPVAGLPRSFQLLLGALLMNQTAAVLPFLLLYLVRGRGLTPALAGLLVGLAGAAATVAQPLGGLLADRFGPRRVLVVAPLLAAAATGLLFLARGTVLLGAAGVGVSLVSGLFRPATSASVAALVPGEEQGQAYSLQSWAANLGFVSSALLAGVLAEGHFSVLFALDAASSVACGLLMTWLPASLDAAGRSSDASERRGLGRALRDRRLLALAALQGVFLLGLGQIFGIFALAMTADHLSTAAYGVALASNGILIVVLQPFVLPWLRRFRTSRQLTGGMVLLAGGLALTGVVSTTAGYVAAVLVMTLGEIATAVAARLQISAMAPEGWTGRYLGIQGTGSSVGISVAPVLGGALYGAVGSSAWFLVAGTALAGAVGYLALGDGPPPRGSAPPVPENDLLLRA